MPRSIVAGLCGKIMFTFVRSRQTIFQSGCTTLQFHKQECPLAPNPCQHLVLAAFQAWAILKDLHMCVLVIQLCPTLCDPMDCSPTVSSVHGIFQARLLEWVAIPFPAIFPTQGSNSSLLHCRHILYFLSHQVSPIVVSNFCLNLHFPDGIRYGTSCYIFICHPYCLLW